MSFQPFTTLSYTGGDPPGGRLALSLLTLDSLQVVKAELFSPRDILNHS